MTRIYQQFNNNETVRIFLLSFLIFSLIASGVLYIFSISWGVKEMAGNQRKMAELKIFEEENKILEGKSTGLLKEFDLEYAYNLGYIDAENYVRFVAKTKSVAKN